MRNRAPGSRRGLSAVSVTSRGTIGRLPRSGLVANDAFCAGRRSCADEGLNWQLNVLKGAVTAAYLSADAEAEWRDASKLSTELRQG